MPVSPATQQRRSGYYFGVTQGNFRLAIIKRDTNGGLVYAVSWKSGETGRTEEEASVTMAIKTSLCWVAFLAVSSVAAIAVARTNTVRIVTYNIEADTPGIETPSWTTPRPGLIQPADTSGNATGTTSDGGVLAGIGELPVGTSNNYQALDIVVLQETTSNTVTIDPIVSAMNTYYGTPGMYARSPVQGTNSGGSSNVGFGNGPNALVYNTQKLTLVASVGVNPPGGTSQLGSASGEYRQVMRYQFRPIGGTSADDFYIYVSHYKAGSGSSNENLRLGEATIIRNDAAGLPSGSRIIYAGDYNVQSSAEAAYQKILSSTQINAGLDPYNLTGSTSINWSANSNLSQKTHSANSLGNRYDYMLMTSALNPTDAFTASSFNATSTGLQLIPNTYQTFGNNGTTAYHTGTDTTANHSLDGVVQNGGTFISASTLKNDLQFASDHLPVMADFSLGPGISIWNGNGSSSNWNTSQDWDSSPIDGDALQFAGLTRLTNSNNSLNVVGAITFNSGAGTFTLSGNAVTNLGGITNNSTNSQNVNFNQTLGAAQQFNAASGNLTVNGTVANGGNALTVTGSSNTTLAGVVSGTGSLAENRQRQIDVVHKQHLQRRHHGQRRHPCGRSRQCPGHRRPGNQQLRHHPTASRLERPCAIAQPDDRRRRQPHGHVRYYR